MRYDQENIKNLNEKQKKILCFLFQILCIVSISIKRTDENGAATVEYFN